MDTLYTAIFQFETTMYMTVYVRIKVIFVLHGIVCTIKKSTMDTTVIYIVSLV